MAKLNGLKALFTNAGVRGMLAEKAQAYDDKTLETLQYIGETFVNEAREFGNYHDRTGNLRSSIGYIILKNGKRVDANFQLSKEGTDRDTGLQQGQEFAEEMAQAYPRGFVLIGVAGMQYAAAVESLENYDVITGSAPSDNEVKSYFDAIEF